MKRVLVAYASKHGATKGIAEFIAEKLRSHNLIVDVHDVRDKVDVKDYDAFVIGSALYMNHWMKEAVKFLSKNKDILSARSVWLFSSGPVGNERKDAKGRDLLDPIVSGPKELGELVEYSHPLDHRIFFGVLNPDNQGFIYRQMRKSAAVRESLPEGDFRNWSEIEAWCTGIAGTLEGLSTTMTV